MSVNWTRDAAAHLLRRAGFGGTPAEIDSLYARGLEGAVSHLVDYESIDVSAYEATLSAKGYNLQRITGLQQWFMDRMAFSPRPLEEKMTYFWNLHWTSGIAKVRGVTLLYNQNQTERRLALAKFDDLVVAISQDPAMLVWLDNATNRVGRPNENYARELMELFTLGIGHYTEEDVREVARALTGWTVANYNRDTGYNAATFVNRAQFHDTGTKTILGHSGNYDGTDAIAIILGLTDAGGSVSGRFIGSKLWAYFAGTWPPAHVVDSLESAYSAEHSIREVVRAILLEPEQALGRRHGEAPQELDRHRAQRRRDRGAHEQRPDLELRPPGGADEHLRGRRRRDRQQDGGEECPADHNLTGKNSRAMCSSTGSFFLMTPCSSRTSCIELNASTLTWPFSEKSGPEILCAARTASGLQPIFLDTISAASGGCSCMNLAAPKSAFITLRIVSA